MRPLPRTTEKEINSRLLWRRHSLTAPKNHHQTRSGSWILRSVQKTIVGNDHSFKESRLGRKAEEICLHAFNRQSALAQPNTRTPQRYFQSQPLNWRNWQHSRDRSKQSAPRIRGATAVRHQSDWHPLWRNWLECSKRRTREIRVKGQIWCLKHCF